MALFVAFQPVFDAELNVAGHQFSYRRPREAPTGAPDEPVHLPSLEALLEPGLQGPQSGQSTFLSLDPDMRRSRVLDLIPVRPLVLEIESYAHEESEERELGRELRARGHRIALPYLPDRTSEQVLLEDADIVRFDLSARLSDSIRGTAAGLRDAGKVLFATGVGDADTHALAHALGFELLAGPHYTRPDMLPRQELSGSSTLLVQLLSLLRNEHAPDAVIGEAFRSDPELSYRLLRMIRSAALGGRGVTSLGHALRLLGRDPLYRWVSVLFVRSQRGGHGLRSEVVRSSLFRGRMCELVAGSVGLARSRQLPAANTLFLIGLLSRIDALLGMPLPEALERVDLSAETREALLKRHGPAGEVLRSVEAYEAGDWEGAEAWARRAGADVERLGEFFLDALGWTRNRMSIHEGT